MARKPLSSVDTAWLRMEDPTNLMMITGVMVFGTPMDRERLKATVEHRLLRFDRFRKRPIMPAFGSPYWEDDPDFDLNYHVQRAVLPPPGDQASLQDLASLLSSTQLDFSKPLWQIHLVEKYGDGCALICRLHHSIGDGLALVHVLLSLTDAAADAPWPETSLQEIERRGRGQRPQPFRRTRTALRTTRRVVGALGQGGWQMLTRPSRVRELAHQGAGGAAALARLLLLWPDPKTVFKGPLDIPKRAAWSAPIPLADAKAVGRGLGGTLNDVLLTAMTGGLRRYLHARGQPVDGLNFRAVIPVNLRQPGAEAELGNKFGLVFLSLPVGIVNPGSRLRELKRRMDALKDSLEAPVAFGILYTIGRTPETIQDIVVNIFGLKGTAVMTNVIGPKERIYLAGAPLEGLMFWVPQSGHLGMGVSILSYAGHVRLGLITDEGLVPDPETIIAGFHAEFDELLALARQAEEQPNITKMVAMLDDATASLDAMLEAESLVESPGGDVEATTSMPAAVPWQCQALTKTSQPCKNRPLPGSSFCRVHQKA
jgi:diacylglycerol O-acyltransferase